MVKSKGANGETGFNEAATKRSRRLAHPARHLIGKDLDASMRPRPSGRGDAFCQWRSSTTTVRFNEAATKRSRRWQRHGQQDRRKHGLQ